MFQEIYSVQGLPQKLVMSSYLKIKSKKFAGWKIME